MTAAAEKGPGWDAENAARSKEAWQSLAQDAALLQPGEECGEEMQVDDVHASWEDIWLAMHESTPTSTVASFLKQGQALPWSVKGSLMRLQLFFNELDQRNVLEGKAFSCSCSDSKALENNSCMLLVVKAFFHNGGLAFLEQEWNKVAGLDCSRPSEALGNWHMLAAGDDPARIRSAAATWQEKAGDAAQTRAWLLRLLWILVELSAKRDGCTTPVDPDAKPLQCAVTAYKLINKKYAVYVLNTRLGKRKAIVSKRYSSILNFYTQLRDCLDVEGLDLALPYFPSKTFSLHATGTATLDKRRKQLHHFFSQLTAPDTYAHIVSVPSAAGILHSFLGCATALEPPKGVTVKVVRALVAHAVSVHKEARSLGVDVPSVGLEIMFGKLAHPDLQGGQQEEPVGGDPVDAQLRGTGNFCFASYVASREILPCELASLSACPLEHAIAGLEVLNQLLVMHPINTMFFCLDDQWQTWFMPLLVPLPKAIIQTHSGGLQLDINTMASLGGSTSSTAKGVARETVADNTKAFCLAMHLLVCVLHHHFVSSPVQDVRHHRSMHQMLLASLAVLGSPSRTQHCRALAHTLLDAVISKIFSRVKDFVHHHQHNSWNNLFHVFAVVRTLLDAGSSSSGKSVAHLTPLPEDITVKCIKLLEALKLDSIDESIFFGLDESEAEQVRRHKSVGEGYLDIFRRTCLQSPPSLLKAVKRSVSKGGRIGKRNSNAGLSGAEKPDLDANPLFTLQEETKVPTKSSVP